MQLQTPLVYTVRLYTLYYQESMLKRKKKWKKVIITNNQSGLKSSRSSQEGVVVVFFFNSNRDFICLLLNWNEKTRHTEQFSFAKINEKWWHLSYCWNSIFQTRPFSNTSRQKIKRITINVNNPRAFVGFHHNKWEHFWNALLWYKTLMVSLFCWKQAIKW